MENEIFERDYKKEHEKQPHSRDVELLDQAIAGGFFRKYSESMDAYPKVVNPEQQKNYESVLSLCDHMASQWGGRVHGEVRYNHWDAFINLYLPFAEFSNRESWTISKKWRIRQKRFHLNRMPTGGSASIFSSAILMM